MSISESRASSPAPPQRPESGEAAVAAAEVPADLGRRRLSGSFVVLGMFGFALLVILAMFAYWDAYTRPFRPLQAAIAAEFPKCIPRVTGGRHKSHKPDAVPTLRIVINVPFDPMSQEKAVAREATLGRLAELARAHHPLDDYEALEIHLVHRRPEQESLIWTESRPVRDWFAAAEANHQEARLPAP